MTADLEIDSVTKRFGNAVAVDNASLTVERGEIMAFLGPSGCGKSTLLQIIAGFIQPDAGRLRLRGRSLDDVPPNQRRVGMVFQHYALFPHMTVRGNIEYGLEAQGQNRGTISSRVAEVIALLKLEGFEKRYPNELSGGQKQRVAIARTLAVRPDLLLLDEALSALDKNLRESMQIELSLLLRRLGITTVFVTHDQREAFSVADRIAVMEKGRIVRIGSPQEVYQRPGSSFVLEFLGSTSSFPGQVEQGAEGLVAVADWGLRVPLPEPAPLGPAQFYVRAEDVRLSATPTDVHPARPVRIALVTFLGNVQRAVVEVGGGQIVIDCPPRERLPGGAAAEATFLDFPPERLHVVPAN